MSNSNQEPSIIRHGVCVMDPNNSTNSIPNTVAVNSDGSINIGGSSSASPVVVAIASAQTGITPIASTTLESNHVLKGTAGNLFGLDVTSGSTAGFVMLFDATTAPGDGAVTPLKAWELPANTSIGLSWLPGPPLKFSTGIVAVFSSTGPFTKTASATAFFSGEIV